MPLIELNKSANAVGICAAAGSSGVTVGAELKLSGNKVTGVADPTSDQDAATKAYVDAKIKALAAAAGVTL